MPPSVPCSTVTPGSISAYLSSTAPVASWESFSQTYMRHSLNTRFTMVISGSVFARAGRAFREIATMAALVSFAISMPASVLAS